MSAYFHGCGGGSSTTDMHATAAGDGSLQTLYLMNPSFSGYSMEAAASCGAVPANMALLNSGISSLCPTSFGSGASLAGAPPESHHFVSIPFQSFQATAMPSFQQYSLWAPAAPSSDHADAVLPAPHRQAATLSLSLMSPLDVAAAASPAVNGNAGELRFLSSSKYLKVVQRLLDEVVSVGNYKKPRATPAAQKNETKKIFDDMSECDHKSEKDDDEAASVAAKNKKAAELTTGDRQELQMKKVKLVGMLDEVVQRYRQYSQQMQMVVASFEAVAGHGSARTYTSLALETISKQFRCLRDAISTQIRSVSASLGEEADSKSFGSRLRLIDHQLRQQRALQQLGMINNNPWRPQRGLPERAVSVLRAWLFEHFLHPYPKDSEKIMLAKQTGLTRSQVSNWFINARVRLWKPMVEEMYAEETKGGDPRNNQTGENDPSMSGSSRLDSGPMKLEDTPTPRSSGPPTEQSPARLFDDGGDPAAAMLRKLKRPRLDELSFHAPMNNSDILMQFMAGGNSSLIANNGCDNGRSGGVLPEAPDYSMGDMAGGLFSSEQAQVAPWYPSNGGVSLTLGLQHCDSIPIAGTNQSLLSNSGMVSVINSSSSNRARNTYDINVQNSKSFSSQLMRKFVPS